MSGFDLASFRIFVQGQASLQSTADLIGVSKSCVHNWYHGHKSPRSRLHLRAIEDAMLRVCSPVNTDESAA